MIGASSTLSTGLTIGTVNTLNNESVSRVIRLPKAGNAIEVAAKIARPTIPVSRVKKSQPSWQNTLSYSTLNESKTLLGKETIPLPIVTGQYTRTEGVSLVSDPSRDQQTSIGQLEKNTRLEVTDKGTAEPFNTTEEGKNWWKVTIVDGTYIGKVGWVRQADLSDTKTE